MSWRVEVEVEEAATAAVVFAQAAGLDREGLALTHRMERLLR
jgi:hypothetical protein